MLIAHPASPYSFLKGIAPYSCGVRAAAGAEIARAVFDSAPRWEEGFERIEAHLQTLGLPRTALCGTELRSPAPFSMGGFIEFNQQYCLKLQVWELSVGELNPVARTNVAPVVAPPDQVRLHAFSYVQPAITGHRPTYVVAGAGELLDGILESQRIIRPGDRSAAAMEAKMAYVVEVMDQRLAGLGGQWEQTTAVDIYTSRLLPESAVEMVIRRLGPAGHRGLSWHHSRPPVEDIDYEMDLRSVRLELLLS
jgi:hypothetical protein